MLPSIEGADAAPTVIVPRVQPSGHSPLRTLLPWVGFGLLSVVVIAATSLWSASLRTTAPAPRSVDAAALPSVTTTPTAELPTPTSAVRQQVPSSAARRRTAAHVAEKPAPARVDPAQATARILVPTAAAPISTATAAAPLNTRESSTPPSAGPAADCADDLAAAVCVGRGTRPPPSPV